MARKRIALSVDPELHEILNGIAHYQKKTTTTVIADILNQNRMILEAMLKAYQDYEKGIPLDMVMEGLLQEGLANLGVNEEELEQESDTK
ncbi:hypothetical protein NI401_14035 [Acinetobacter indicus]|uniref:hypothetical protein n=1 Tax=Acinetobacter indicus TaxID=756892 RepID=UPI00209AEAF7|nr:hypothetical protein [Acinetobacter indicus]MCO8103993.1 hypothetical protein [Acinetobacter indicus]